MTIVNIALPKYEVVLPISGRKITFRPFTSKEEKVLLIARESENTEEIMCAVDNLMMACSFGECSSTNVCKVDAEYLFLQLRNKSIGEVVVVNGICKECAGKTLLNLNLELVEVKNKQNVKEFKLADDLWITLKIPSMKDALLITENTDDELPIAISLDTVVYGENSFNANEYTLEEKKELVGSLTKHQLTQLNSFFTTFPVLELNVKYNCGQCNAENTVHIEGLENFFI